MENTNKTKPSKHLRINIHMNLQRLHQHPPDFHNSGTNEILELRGEVEKFPMPTQKLYLIDNYLEKENSFFYGMPLYIQATLNERLSVQLFLIMFCQNNVVLVGMGFLLLFLLFYLVVACVGFCFFLFFCLLLCFIIVFFAIPYRYFVYIL